MSSKPCKLPIDKQHLMHRYCVSVLKERDVTVRQMTTQIEQCKENKLDVLRLEHNRAFCWLE